MVRTKNRIGRATLTKGFKLLCTAKAMTELYEANFKLVSKYVHATSRGHEAIQLALALQLQAQDYLYPYYRDDAMLLGIGMRPYDLMLQLLAKRDDPFSGGRTYYAHPSLKDADKPKIPHQSSATGMQAIPATGAAMGLQYKEQLDIAETSDGIVVCSLGDASVTEGEVAEAFQMATLRQLPILYLVQDNEWDISAKSDETRAQNAAEYAAGFKGLEAISLDGSDFLTAFAKLERVIRTIRSERRPFLVHANVPLLNHHTSGVRMEWYRDDLETARLSDPYPILKGQLLDRGFTPQELNDLEQAAQQLVAEDFEAALQAADPQAADLFTHAFAPTPVELETGTRTPADGKASVMVDSALHAVEEIMRADKKAMLYGQDVGARLGGVFREAATLAQKFGEHRVFNTPIQEAFIIGSTVGMSAVGLKPIVEVQFADYIWPGLNQLFTEVSRSCYLSNGKYPVSMVLRVPIGAYGSGGPYHSSSVESVLTQIRGIKIVYPSNGADLKGLMKAAYHDPNPVVILEHKGLYWSKMQGTNRAKTIEPAADYVLPLGKAKLIAPKANEQSARLTIVTYGMGVHWACNAVEQLEEPIEIIDLRTLYPLDEATIFESVKRTNRCLVLTEEAAQPSFASSLSGRIQAECFRDLDAPVLTLGAENMPAIPLNSVLEQRMLPNVDKVKEKIRYLLDY
ncbi:MAG: thiamine pyrophosphate-dependent enzyme [Bacteroidota bacterium]